MKNLNYKSIITVLGVLGFVTIVTVLHFVQTDYDPIHQLMSELALGKYGSFMLAAFFSFSVAVFFAQLILADYKNSLLIRILLLISSFSLAGAGIYELGEHTELHVMLVMFAFILIVLSMYLTPRLLRPFHKGVPVLICWGLGLGTTVAAGLGSNVVPIGLAQRIAVGCILTWLLWFACHSPRALANQFFK